MVVDDFITVVASTNWTGASEYSNDENMLVIKNKIIANIQEKEFSNLKGLIYFTDGFGEFPAKKPDYDTAFVFVDDEYNNPDVPPWAIKLILQKDEI